jgi:hypothetical protein
VQFALGETIELQHDANVIGQQQRLDLAPQAAERERDHRRPLVAADVATLRVERDADFKPLVRHLTMPWACGAGCKARTRTDEGAILP